MGYQTDSVAGNLLPLQSAQDERCAVKSERPLTSRMFFTIIVGLVTVMDLLFCVVVQRTLQNMRRGLDRSMRVVLDPSSPWKPPC